LNRIRLEFADSRSFSFAWVLRLCKKFPAFQEFEEGGVKIYSIEVTDTDPELSSLETIFNKVRGWKQVAYYFNDRLTSASDVFRYIWDRKYRRNRALYRGDAKEFIDSL
jgi:hypothetical protein